MQPLLSCRFRSLIEASKADLISLGFPQFTIEDFHDVVSSTLSFFHWLINV